MGITASESHWPSNTWITTPVPQLNPDVSNPNVCNYCSHWAVWTYIFVVHMHFLHRIAHVLYIELFSDPLWVQYIRVWLFLHKSTVRPEDANLVHKVLRNKLGTQRMMMCAPVQKRNECLTNTGTITSKICTRTTTAKCCLLNAIESKIAWEKQ